MGIVKLTFKEMWYRKFGTLTILAVIAMSAGVIVAVYRVSLGSINEMRKAALLMGKNITILPAGLSIDDYWSGNMGRHFLPESDVKRLADYCSRGKILARHFQGRLEFQATVDGTPLIISGITVEVDPKAPRAVTKEAQKPIARGEAELGSYAAELLDLKEGDTFEGTVQVEGKTFHKRYKIKKVRKETGTLDDYKMFVDVKEAQEMLGVKDVVNVVEAVGCICAAKDLPKLAKQIESALYAAESGTARARAYHFTAIARARILARKGTMRDANKLTAVTLILAPVVLAIYAVFDMRRRRRELGILLAIGVYPRQIGYSFTLKMLLLVLVGSAVGCIAAGQLTELLGVSAFGSLHPSMRNYLLYMPVWKMYLSAVGITAALSTIPVIAGTIAGISTDPVTVLREG